MKFLIDTQIVIWYAMGNKRLKPDMKSLIDDLDNQVYVSLISLWEIAIKTSISKLDMGQTIRELQQLLVEEQFLFMPLQLTHLEVVETMPLHHRDPFDRMLVAQAIVEKLPIMSSDKKLDAYGVARIWG